MGFGFGDVTAADVAGNGAPLDGLLQGLVQDPMHQADGARSEAGVELGLVEVLHVVWRQHLELPVAQSRLYMVADHALVALEGRRLDGTFHRTVQPAVQECRKRPMLTLEDEPAITVRHSLRELL